MRSRRNVAAMSARGRCMIIVALCMAVLVTLWTCIWGRSGRRSKVVLDVGQFDNYYNEAERHMKKQWRQHVWREIQHSDFTNVVEIAAGWGRNTAMLLPLVRSIIVTDISEASVEHMRRRFANETTKAVFKANNGTSLPMVPTGWASFVYSWDAMVHFADFVIASYVTESSLVEIGPAPERSSAAASAAAG